MKKIILFWVLILNINFILFVFSNVQYCCAETDYGLGKVKATSGLPTKGSGNKIKSTIESVTDWILGILASLSILMIIASGIIYVTSAGDQGRVDMAKNMLTYAIVGLVVALLGYVIVSTVVSVVK